MATSPVSTNLVRFPRERSTSLNFVDHVDGVTTIGFMDQRAGVPKCDYDYADPEMALYLPLISAERPGSVFRTMRNDGKVPQYTAKRAAVGAPEPTEKPAKAAKAVSGIVEMPEVESSIKVTSGMPALPNSESLMVGKPKTEVAMVPKESDEVEAKALSLSQRVQACAITDHATYERAVELTRGVKALQAEAEEHHRPMIAAGLAAHRAALAALKRVMDPLDAAEQTLKQRIMGWQRAEQARIDEENRKAREEAARIQREAEERQQAEYQRQLAEARAQAEAAQREREALIEQKMEEAEANGASPVEVQAIMAQVEEEPLPEVFVPPPPVPVIVPRVPVAIAPKVQGVSTPMTVVGVIESKAKLLAFIAANVGQYEALVEIKQGAVDRLGKATDGKMTLPGVRWEKRASVSIRK